MARCYTWHPTLLAPFPCRGAGVYAIINRRNNKIYIGSSVRMNHRWTEHRMELSRKEHSNRYLQRAFEKEPDNFQVEVIETLPAPDKAALLSREQFWINFYRSWLPENGYNIAPKAESCLGVKHSEETRALMRLRGLGRKASPEARARMSAAQRGSKHKPFSQESKAKLSAIHTGMKWSDKQREGRMRWLATHPKPRSKPVGQYSMDGTFINSFSSIHAAEVAFGRRSNIYAVCKGKRNESFGYVWKYLPCHQKI